MKIELIEFLARQVATGSLSVEQMLAQLDSSDLGDGDRPVELDLDRQRRCGYPEVIYGAGKSAEVLIETIQQQLAAGQPVLVTRLDAEKYERVAKQQSDGVYNAIARTLRIPSPQATDAQPCGKVMVVAAGTSDLPVSEEAYETLTWMGCRPERLTDIGVAGPQRLLRRLDVLQSADVIVVAAGMEGALPSVVGGYVDCPVVAVPTSVGYGANLGGISALLSMLNSCAANVTVVNIDAGFKAGYVAGLIARRISREQQR